jgi:prepilin-type processing-associated H-X9-DG protein
MRQIMIAVQTYALDYDDQAPQGWGEQGATPSNANFSISAFDKLGRGYDGRNLSEDQITGSEYSKDEYSVDQMALYLCPAESESKLASQFRNNIRRDYGLNGNRKPASSNYSGPTLPNGEKVTGLTSRYIGRTLSSIEDPSGTISVAENAIETEQLGKGWNRGGLVTHPADQLWSRSAAGSGEFRSSRHGRLKFNYAFVDGHVNRHTATETGGLQIGANGGGHPHLAVDMWTGAAGDDENLLQ